MEPPVPDGEILSGISDQESSQQSRRGEKSVYNSQISNTSTSSDDDRSIRARDVTVMALLPSLSESDASNEYEGQGSRVILSHYDITTPDTEDSRNNVDDTSSHPDDPNPDSIMGIRMRRMPNPS
jgi:hypothetical protein